MVHEPVLPGLTGREDAVVISGGLRSVDTPAAVHSEHVLDLGADPDDLVGRQDGLGYGPCPLAAGWWSTPRAYGKADRFPSMPAASRMAPTPIACPTQVVATGG